MAKRRIPVKNFLTNEDFQEFIEREKEWMYTQITEAIERAFFEGTDYADIMEAKITETMSTIQMRSENYEWVTSLKLAMKWYESEENYERCGELLKLIKSIETQTK
jgi:hypothetical protein